MRKRLARALGLGSLDGIAARRRQAAAALLSQLLRDSSR